jgi:hypothetical protein
MLFCNFRVGHSCNRVHPAIAQPRQQFTHRILYISPKHIMRLKLRSPGARQTTMALHKDRRVLWATPQFPTLDRVNHTAFQRVFVTIAMDKDMANH